MLDASNKTKLNHDKVVQKDVQNSPMTQKVKIEIYWKKKEITSNRAFELDFKTKIHLLFYFEPHSFPHKQFTFYVFRIKISTFFILVSNSNRI